MVKGGIGWGNVRPRCDVQVTDSRHGIKAVLERGKCATLGKQHEQAIKAFVEVGVSFGLEQLDAKI